MKVMKVDVQVGRWASEATDVLVLFQCEGSELSEQETASLDKALGGSISDLLRSKEFEGKTAELVLLHTHRKIPAKRLLLVGLGKKDALGLETIRQAWVTPSNGFGKSRPLLSRRRFPP